jgi:hypothetical protein
MPRPPKRKATHQKVSRDGRGRFIRGELDFINTEASTLEIVEMGLGDDLLSEQLWENDEVSDWGSDVDSEAEQDICNRLSRDGAWLKWRPDANLEKSSRGPYKVGKMPKSTYYDKWGPSGSWTAAAKGVPKLENFFSQAEGNNQQVELEQDISSDEENALPSENIVLSLEKDLKENFTTMSANEYVWKRAIFEYSVRLIKGEKKMKASTEVVKIVYNSNSKSKATRVREMAKYWYNNHMLPISRRGKHQKLSRIIDDEDTAEKCHTWIRANGGHTTPHQFKEFVQESLFPGTGINKTISISTVRRWLNILGYHYQQQKQGIYYDGHEREDVVEYRRIFLSEIAKFEKYMATYEGEDMKRIAPILNLGEKEYILVVHDECIFYSNDGKRGTWAKSGELPLRKKGNGKSIMVSEFLTEACGRLKLTVEHIENYPDVPEEARVCLKPGANEEGYWTAAHLIEQVEYKAIPIFEALFPNCIAVFVFDNSSNHSAFAPDALVAKRMNIGSGGNAPKMRDTFWGPNHEKQSMNFPDGQPKGIKQILCERGLWRQNMVGECKLCRNGNSDSLRTDCCGRRIISLQPDFLAQRSALVETIENSGHVCIFLPKFHCELNFIERYWGAAKRYARNNCNYTWSGLQETVIDSVDVITIRRFARKAWRYMDLYRHRITGKLAEYAAKKYKSHRRIPEDAWDELRTS